MARPGKSEPNAMNFTRELVLLAATALAWFAFAMMVGQPEAPDPFLRDIVHTPALVRSGVLGVRLGGLLLVDVSRTILGKHGRGSGLRRTVA